MVSRALRRRVARHSAQLQGVGVYGMVVRSAGLPPPLARRRLSRQGKLGGFEFGFGFVGHGFGFGGLFEFHNCFDFGRGDAELLN